MRALIFVLPLLTGCATPIVDLPALARQIQVPANYCPYGTVNRLGSCQTIQAVEIKKR
jgi:hypothetical protein